jgi:hypothetical protein
MADSLTVASAVETLVDLDLVDLDADGPWPGEPDRADAYEPDWTQVHPETRSAECVGRHAYEFACEPWSAVFDEIRRQGSGGFTVPPPARYRRAGLVYAHPLLRSGYGDLHSGIGNLNGLYPWAWRTAVAVTHSLIEVSTASEF